MPQTNRPQSNRQESQYTDPIDIETAKHCKLIRQSIASHGNVAKGMQAVPDSMIAMLVDHSYTPRRLAKRLGENTGSLEAILDGCAQFALQIVLRFAKEK